MNEQQVGQDKLQKRGMSIGAAIVLGISAIIVAAIIAGAIVFSRGARIIEKLDIKDLEGLEIQVHENGEVTNVNVQRKEVSVPGDELQ